MLHAMKCLLPLALAGVLFAGCSSPNAYKEYDDHYGYTGGFNDDSVVANEGYVTFTGAKDISQVLIRKHCKRRIAEMCIERDYDYFKVFASDGYNSTTSRKVVRWWGSSRDAYGNEYNRYKVHFEKDPTYVKRMSFRCFRGPRPPDTRGTHYYSVREILHEFEGSRYAGKSLAQDEPVTCPHCSRTVTTVDKPEHCPGCGYSLFETVLCPHCHDEVAAVADGGMKCPECSKLFRVGWCPHCVSRHTLRDYCPFNCTYCGHLSEHGVEAGEDSFRCPHCAEPMEWPDEKYGDYECPACRNLFAVIQCDCCGLPHALQASTNFTCWACCAWVKPEQGTRGTELTTD